MFIVIMIMMMIIVIIVVNIFITILHSPSYGLAQWFLVPYKPAVVWVGHALCKSHNNCDFWGR